MFESQEGRLTSLDGIRALSILWVIAFHTVWYLGFYISTSDYSTIVRSGPVHRFFLEGYYGVDMFFVLSGFLISTMLIKDIQSNDRISLRAFYIRRFFRIVPVYVFMLLVNAVLLKMNNQNIWANLLFINNFIPIQQQAMGWTWSLAIEEQFYLLFPVLLIVLFKFGRRRYIGILAGLIVFAFLVRFWIVVSRGPFYPLVLHPSFGLEPFTRYFDLVYDKTHARIGAILFGILAAFLISFTNIRELLKSNRSIFKAGMTVGFVYVIWAVFSRSTCLYGYCANPTSNAFAILYETIKHYAIAMVVSLSVIYCVLAGETSRISRVLSSRSFYPIAELSYSAYLVHPIVINVVYFFFLQGRDIKSFNLIVLVVGMQCLVFSVSLLTYRGIERPFRAWGRRIAKSYANPPQQPVKC
jgi:peptidoglycan/LPS O-acetylase OafA/YrhL